MGADSLGGSALETQRQHGAVRDGAARVRLERTRHRCLVHDRIAPHSSSSIRSGSSSAHRPADVDDISWALELLGVAWAESGSPAAARLLGAAEALRESLGGTLEGVELALHDRALAAFAAGPDSAAAEAAWAAGRTLTADEAVVLALDSPP